jgi:acyl-coenzyme A synthetase/AMP-(fatty) acid ligase
LGLARQKTPEMIVGIDEFPRTASGKIMKAELRRRLAETRASQATDGRCVRA